MKNKKTAIEFFQSLKRGDIYRTRLSKKGKWYYRIFIKVEDIEEDCKRVHVVVRAIENSMYSLHTWYTGCDILERT